MNEQDIDNEYDTWLSIVSKFIISRSSRLISSDTQKDGRTLLFLSALSSLFYVGVATFDEYSSQGLKVGVTFIPIIIEVVCFYFACSFAIDAYSELKIWQFKTQIKGSDDESPIKILKRAQEKYRKQGREIVEKYEELFKKAGREIELNTSIEMTADAKGINQTREYSKKLEESIERKKELGVSADKYRAAQAVELKELNDEYEILKFKIKSLDNEIPAVVKIYKFKYFINIIFPLLSFFISIATLIFYLISHC